jgi:hypothetical protein
VIAPAAGIGLTTTMVRIGATPEPRPRGDRAQGISSTSRG